MNLIVRPARPDDAGAIAAILNRIIDARVYTAFDTRITEEEERQYLTAFPARGVFVVAVDADDGSVVGFQSMEPFATFTHAFDHVGVLGTYVNLDRRRQGVASRLFASTYEAARAKGYRKIFTYIRADNPAALATYMRYGFRIVGVARAQACIDGRDIDEIVVERMLEVP
jgi:L-amino acid N-acyltransferase YncA